MATARRSRKIASNPERVWKLISDPNHMPRWWPEVRRMENVDDDRFTQVFITKRGRHVRADFHVLDSERPHRRVWEQEMVGTPFERVLKESVTEIVLEPDPEGTVVNIRQRQKLRGFSRTGGLLLRRASGKKLDEALDGLERIC